MGVCPYSQHVCIVQPYRAIFVHFTSHEKHENFIAMNLFMFTVGFCNQLKMNKLLMLSQDSDS